MKEGLLERKYQLNHQENTEFDNIHSIYKKEVKSYSINQIDERYLVTFEFNDGFDSIGNFDNTKGDLPELNE